jgi:hypothetical protein
LIESSRLARIKPSDDDHDRQLKTDDAIDQHVARDAGARDRDRRAR